jgi:hypothetical protein
VLLVIESAKICNANRDACSPPRIPPHPSAIANTAKSSSTWNQPKASSFGPDLKGLRQLTNDAIHLFKAFVGLKDHERAAVLHFAKSLAAAHRPTV